MMSEDPKTALEEEGARAAANNRYNYSTNLRQTQLNPILRHTTETFSQLAIGLNDPGWFLEMAR